MRLQSIPLIGGAYSDDTKPFSAQACINYLPVMAEKQGTRSPAMLRGCPGLTEVADTGQASIRGLKEVEGRLFVVSGPRLYELKPNNTLVELGGIPGTGRVSMAHNQITGGHELVIAQPASAYVYNTVDETLSPVADDGFVGFGVVDFCDGYIVGSEPFGRFWAHSDLADAKSYNTIDRYEAEAAPDRITGLITTHREVFVLGARTGQFFYNTGGATGTFENRNGSEMEVGSLSPHSLCRIDNSVIWLGNDGIVYRLNGYQPVRISTHCIEQAISRCRLQSAWAFAYEDRGHKVYYLTLPDGETWGYDVATGEWHQRRSAGLKRWRLAHLSRLGSRWIGGDAQSGKLFEVDWSVQDEAGDPLIRERVSGVLHADQNTLRINVLELVMNPGSATSVDSEVEIRYSKDGGWNWSDWYAMPYGRTGQFQQRLRRRQLGAGRHWVFHIRVADAVNADLLAASAEIEA